MAGESPSRKGTSPDSAGSGDCEGKTSSPESTIPSGRSGLHGSEELDMKRFGLPFRESQENPVPNPGIFPAIWDLSSGKEGVTGIREKAPMIFFHPPSSIIPPKSTFPMVSSK